jgi:hypothetical protein
MAKLRYPSSEKVYDEVLVDPHSKMAHAIFYKELDPFGDPLDTLIRCEEGDEIAQSMTCFEFHESKAF